VTLWARLDDNNIVQQVTVGNDDTPDRGYDWIMANLGGRWVETTEDGSMRVRYAHNGSYFDEALDAFYMPKPDDGNPLWFFNETTVQWELPQPVVEEIVLDPNWVA